MDEMTRRIVMDRRGRRGGMRRDYGHRGTGTWEADIRGEYERDGRRGVKGTGPYGIGGRRYYGRDRARSEYDMPYDDYDRRGGYDGHYDEDDYCYDYGYDYGMRDYGGGEMKLSKRELKRKERELMNADGSPAPHFRDMEQIRKAAEQVGARYDGYDEAEFAFVANMLYSDYCVALRKYITPERELMAYAELAKAWLDDEDAPEGSEKLYLYVTEIVGEQSNNKRRWFVRGYRLSNGG